MKLKEILKCCPYKEIAGSRDVSVEGIVYHSNQAKPNFIFCAIKGQNTDGHFFINKAIKKGAKVIVCERPFLRAKEITQIVVEDAKVALAQVSQAFYKFPNKKLKIIGITGTNGKTSVAFLTKSILEEAGFPPGLIGTVYYKANNKIIKMAQRTTPMSLDIIQIFNEFVKRKVKYAVMEVSSHALDLKRVCGLDFEVAVFTGISREHLDWHKNVKNYLNSKLKIIRENKVKFGVINIDNFFSKYFLKILPPQKTITYGFSPKADIYAFDVCSTLNSNVFKVRYKNKEILIKLKIVGDFQISNALAAIGVGILLKIPLKTIKKGLEKLKKVPGRFEVIKAKNFKVVVDYAHTPDAFKGLLSNCQKLPHKKLISVFGCGGTRDKTKREPMGETSGKLADITIITSDNPRLEKPEDIISQIEKGIKKTQGKYLKIIDRKKAIEKAIKMARKDDLVVVAGKGHETSQVFKDKTILFSDKKTVQEAIKKCK